MEEKCGAAGSGGSGCGFDAEQHTLCTAWDVQFYGKDIVKLRKASNL